MAQFMTYYDQIYRFFYLDCILTPEENNNSTKLQDDNIQRVALSLVVCCICQSILWPIIDSIRIFAMMNQVIDNYYEKINISSCNIPSINNKSTIENPIILKSSILENNGNPESNTDFMNYGGEL
ncbi:hypothetical protein PIROE2DRAFT_6272 [Piromyces sp. E2]|nr:hypothetical protein PIROE2DRAFT_6272 [Piromyces sp. E2]|eukprot:OUM66440.1 hypothetical protein PIROE2DRAFT_6272 [Piromyces sp. E2]